MFFCISAFLYSNKNVEDKNKWFLKRYIDLIIPTLLSVVMGVVIYLFWEKSIPYDKIPSMILCGLGLEFFSKDPWLFSQLWFMSYILLCYFTIPFIQKIKINKMDDKKFCLFLISMVLFVQVFCILVKSCLGLDKFFSDGVLMRFYIPYFLIRKYGISNDKINIYMKYLLFISVFSYGLVILTKYMHLFHFGQTIVELIYVYTQTITGIVVFYYLYRFIGKKTFSYKMLEISDKYSFYVYLVHCYFIGYSISILDKIDNIFFAIIVALLLIFMFTIVLEFISKRLMRYFNVLFYNKSNTKV